MPFRSSRDLTPRESLAYEIRLSFMTAGTCFVVSGVAWLVNRLASLSSPLTALAAVGGFYTVMGLGRWWKLCSMKDSGSPEPPEPAH